MHKTTLDLLYPTQRAPAHQPPLWRRMLILAASTLSMALSTTVWAQSSTEETARRQGASAASQSAPARQIAPPAEILVVGATGSIGRLVVEEALREGYRVRALVRDRARAESLLPAQATLIVGDVTQPQTLSAAVDGVAGVVFTHGGGAGEAQAVDYGGVRNILFALEGRPARIALMTAIGVTRPIDAGRLAVETRGWKRRSERLLRASGLPYTIVRPGWFDYNEANQHRLVFLQGDRRQSGTPRDGVIARRQIAQVLVASLSSAAADRKTLELVAEQGTAQTDLDPLFTALASDAQDGLDAVRDQDNLPLAGEPAAFREDLQRFSRPSSR
ncbi:SDR family oxidoreductase [Burkholderia multivorans]|uniref:SDR family oxidoreductase n=1 Tax=Burkholderia multivorans TaxID=87883 RepID=UPI0021C045ED|nr:SDR family oxidoreductase [Burkholderia multivorans]